MKTDKLFYRIFLTQPGILAELIPGIPPDCEFEYSAPVIKEQEFRHDIEAILVSKFPQISPEEILKMLDLKTADITQTRFYRDVFQLGAKEGKAEGKQEGEAQLIIRQVNRRCGVLSPNQEAQISSLDLNQLESLGEALLDFTTIADLEAWLNSTHQEQ